MGNKKGSKRKRWKLTFCGTSGGAEVEYLLTDAEDLGLIPNVHPNTVHQLFTSLSTGVSLDIWLSLFVYLYLCAQICKWTLDLFFPILLSSSWTLCASCAELVFLFSISFSVLSWYQTLIENCCPVCPKRTFSLINFGAPYKGLEFKFWTRLAKWSSPIECGFGFQINRETRNIKVERRLLSHLLRLSGWHGWCKALRLSWVLGVMPPPILNFRGNNYSNTSCVATLRTIIKQRKYQFCCSGYLQKLD